MIPWLENDTPLPAPDRALREPNGLLAAGGSLTVPRLLEAYRKGIFPWFSEGQPVLWWSPDPRMVLIPADFSPRRSLLKVLRNRAYEIRCDSAFERVMLECARTPRPGQDGTWITRAIIDGYCALHDAGLAHSIETWIDGKLVGGLYGVALGRMFYGESMFSHATDTSKIAFAHLAGFLRSQGCGIIDCQMKTDHLASLGACEIPRREFVRRMEHLIAEPAMVGWAAIRRAWHPEVSA